MRLRIGDALVAERVELNHHDVSLRPLREAVARAGAAWGDTSAMPYTTGPRWTSQLPIARCGSEAARGRTTSCFP